MNIFQRHKSFTGFLVCFSWAFVIFAIPIPGVYSSLVSSFETGDAGKITKAMIGLISLSLPWIGLIMMGIDARVEDRERHRLSTSSRDS